MTGGIFRDRIRESVSVVVGVAPGWSGAAGATAFERWLGEGSLWRIRRGVAQLVTSSGGRDWGVADALLLLYVSLVRGRPDIVGLGRVEEICETSAERAHRPRGLARH